MRQITIDEIVYQIDKLNAFDQMELVRLGAPLGLQAFLPLITRRSNFSSLEEAITGLEPEMLIALVERAAALDKEQWDAFRNLTLRLVSKKDPTSGTLIPLIQDGILLHEIELIGLFKIISQSLAENLGNFGRALPILLGAASTAPAV